MDPSTLQVIWTLGAFAVFVGIVAWAWSRRAKGGFAEAERMPFADESKGGAEGSWPR
ncbi:MAG: CcoQ/FixQ family Cbb3-type cytochrome c oxidase assembly chaperone [Candidatus Eisenbacteria bacterium]